MTGMAAVCDMDDAHRRVAFAYKQPCVGVLSACDDCVHAALQTCLQVRARTTSDDGNHRDSKHACLCVATVLALVVAVENVTMRPGEAPLGLFVTTVLSHVTMLPAIYLFYKRGYTFEFALAIFGFVSSFMYHFCESFDVTVLLSERQWHRLDNVGVLGILGTWCVFISCFADPVFDLACKYAVVFVTLVLQQAHPFDLRFTVTPILLFVLFPTVHICFVQRRLPQLYCKYLWTGVAFMLLAVPFFVLGQNEHKDPYRVFHGMWHFFGGAGYFFLWLMMKRSRRTIAQLPYALPCESLF